MTDKYSIQEIEAAFNSVDVWTDDDCGVTYQVYRDRVIAELTKPKFQPAEGQAVRINLDEKSATSDHVMYDQRHNYYSLHTTSRLKTLLAAQAEERDAAKATIEQLQGAMNDSGALVDQLQKRVDELTSPLESDRPESIGQGHRIIYQQRKRIEELQDKNTELLHMVKDINEYEDEVEQLQARIAELEGED